MAGQEWEGFEVIHQYGDAQALADGVLVDVSSLGLMFQGRPVNRLTSGVLEAVTPYLTGHMTLRTLLHTKLSAAAAQGRLHILPPRFWLIENEVGGWTMLRPDER